jgi:hypothetical protein
MIKLVFVTSALSAKYYYVRAKTGFLFRSEIFFQTTQELEYLFFLSCKARNFFPEFNIRLYDKNSESDYFFFPPRKSEYFFKADIIISSRVFCCHHNIAKNMLVFRGIKQSLTDV